MTNHKAKKMKTEVHVQQITSTLLQLRVPWHKGADFYTAVLTSNHISQIPPFKSIQQIEV